MKKSVLFGLVLSLLVLPAAAGVVENIDALIPRLAAEKVAERHSAQLELQSMMAEASRPGAEAARMEFARAASAKAADAAVPQPARVWLVRQLEHAGAAESVPALNKVLQDPDGELRESARRALEKNAAPAAGEALRAALRASTETVWTIGLIESLGERSDAQSVELFAESLKNPALASAAISALGKVGTPRAVEVLWQAYESSPRPAGQALLVAADKLVDQAEKKAAREICTRLYAKCSDAVIRSAALVSLAEVDPGAAIDLIPNALLDNDRIIQVAAVTAGRVAYAKSAPKRFADLLPKLSSSAKILVLRELNTSSEKLVSGLMADPDEGVRLAALETLGRIGGANSVALLVKSAADGQGPVKRIAGEALVRMAGSGTDAMLVKLSGRADPAFRAAAISAIGDRNYRTALPVLLRHAGDTNAVVSGAACKAIAKLGSDAEVEPVAKLALAKVAPAEAALESVVSRSADKSAAAAKLLALAKTASAEQLPILFGPLTMIGSADALAALGNYASSQNNEVREAALRALAGWPDFAAVEKLLSLSAAADTKRVHNALLIQGVARLVKSSESVAAETRVGAALKAIQAAQREEEKKLALSALASVPDRKAADALKGFLSDGALRETAGQAALTLGGSLIKPQRQTALDLIEAVKQADISPELNQKADELLKR